MVMFDASLAGTPTATWEADSRMRDRPSLSLHGVDELIVVAAHPDDETLGAGGLIALCSRRGIPVTVVVVTDGGASGEPGIVAERSRELAAATDILAAGGRDITVIEFGFADGGTRENIAEITAALGPHIAGSSRNALIVAPWRGDGHRDHRVVGEIVAELVGGRRFAEYPIWMWHWAHPDAEATPWQTMATIDVDATKQRALASFRSQTRGEHPVLLPDFLEHFAGDKEYLIVEDGALPAEYFDATYQRHDDPWGLATRWYETRKRELLLASLPLQEYGTALEIGSSIGVTTEALAGRCRELLALDVSAAAVQRARERVGEAATVEVRDVTRDFPGGEFDLVVLSEVGYYFGASGLATVLASIGAALSTHGTLVACHWRHPVADYPLTGDDVHAAIDGIGLHRIVRHEEEDFILEVFSRDPRSVARTTGLL
ncbi:PIG-L family deacetylase [Salinibacterium sp. G-O1]|uniref:PIG-L family deacetylase n=1 Tax=Salinibacterium sp. G-O1 TaxID=3046208 RepID=UPI0024B8C5B4|nr:PIG-L family deacetylase [Salinibacterium sp. G-O1]MDJ0333802.1 PIG-L family deacetylase [Salinibacterium sp. G-O1]